MLGLCKSDYVDPTPVKETKTVIPPSAYEGFVEALKKRISLLSEAEKTAEIRYLRQDVPFLDDPSLDERQLYRYLLLNRSTSWASEVGAAYQYCKERCELRVRIMRRLEEGGDAGLQVVFDENIDNETKEAILDLVNDGYVTIHPGTEMGGFVFRGCKPSAQAEGEMKTALVRSAKAYSEIRQAMDRLKKADEEFVRENHVRGAARLHEFCRWYR